VFIPLTVGGGIRTAEDIRQVLRAGADKVALNTAALARPEFVREAARRFGSSTIVVSIEAIRHGDGRYEAYTDNGRERTGVDAREWAVRAAELGAGELLVTSIDREGTGTGYDTELIRRIAPAVPIPVIACGGAGRLDHLSRALLDGHADALCLASMLHYQQVRAAATAGVGGAEGNTEYLRSGRAFAGRRGVGLETATVAAIKCALTAAGIATREARTAATLE
jgi:imidazole glycerol-phosphate synthase subunit HisF